MDKEEEFADKDPLYVIKINNNNNTIVPKASNKLKINKIILRELNILGSKKSLKKKLKLKLDLLENLLRAKVKINTNKAEVNILDGESGISPGQACVFYLNDETGDKVLGGGWIDKTFNKNLST